MSPTPEQEQQAQQILKRLQAAMHRYSEQADAEIQVGELIAQFREVLGLKPTYFARRLQVAPQTVGRWEKNEVRPRLSQLPKFERLLADPPALSAAVDRGTARAALPSLETRLAPSLLSLEKHAQAVWLFQMRPFLESDQDFMGASIPEALLSGVDYHYVFFRQTAAEQSFRACLQQWREKAEKAQEQDNVPMRGSVTGYCIQDFRLAYQLGLAATPAAWVVIEYRSEQVVRLQRRLDVLLALEVREHPDTAQARVQREEGHLCWLELPTPHARLWLKKLSRLRSQKNSDANVKVIR